ncbi:MAG TPA: DMT family transporter [candidate division Zixibacteria bacterium]
MPPIALLLIILSALLQAALNVPIKGSERKVAFIAGATFISLIIYFPLFIYRGAILGEHGYPIGLWSWIGVIACSLVGTYYYIFLGGAYDRGDLSVVFPVTRGFGPLFILIFALLLLKEKISYLGFLGILITIAGSYMIYLPSFKTSELLHPLRAVRSKTFLFSMAAGACTAAYALINKRNLEVVQPFTLFYLIYIFMTLFLLVFLWIKNRIRQTSLEFKHNRTNLFVFGFFNFISSVLVLYALKMSKVSYLGAARNISVLFGVILGCFFLKEGYGKIRFLASLLIFGGIVLLSLG